MTDTNAANRDSLKRRIDIGRALSRTGEQSRRHRIRGWVLNTFATFLALWVAVWLISGLSTTAPFAVVGAAVLLGIFGALLRPVFEWLAVALGWFGVFVLAVLAQAIVVYVTLVVAPGIVVANFWSAFLASWVVAVVGQVTSWVAGADEQNAFLVEVLRRGLRNPVESADDGQTGVVFIQMDGVSQPLLEWALLAGNLPTLGRWIREGSHVARGWTNHLPSTTPISQAGILHGNTHNMPAFRWYEKDLGRLVVANSPPDAALIESRLSDGRGLLADGGVSVSNLFSGDAPRAFLTMSWVGAKRAAAKPRDLVSFFATPYGFGRAVTRTIGEMIKEMYQSRRAIRLGVLPRVPRHGFYIVLRGFTNVMQRDMNVVLVAEAMMGGAKSVYVDFLDYDEIAHHAGVARPESLAAVAGIDAAIGRLEAVARFTPREYEFVILSDHGQSQGSTFLQRYGQPLEEVVRGLMGGAEDMVAATGKDEDYGPLNAFLSSLTGSRSMTSRMTSGALGENVDDGVVTLGPAGDTPEVEATSELVVAGSGNFGLVWFPQVPGRVTLEDAETRWPGLVRSLAEHPGVSFIMVESRARGPVVLGAGGARVLRTGEVDGIDPLAPFDAHVADDLLRLTAYDNAADIFLNSQFDPETGEVAAFEELVGCHGGTGGWQTKPMLVHPAAWPLHDEELLGAEALHFQLVRWLEALGHRSDLKDAVSG